VRSRLGKRNLPCARVITGGEVPVATSSWGPPPPSLSIFTLTDFGGCGRMFQWERCSGRSNPGGNWRLNAVVEHRDDHAIAIGFACTADLIVEHWVDRGPNDLLFEPLVFNHRHALELILKAAIRESAARLRTNALNDNQVELASVDNWLAKGASHNLHKLTVGFRRKDVRPGDRRCVIAQGGRMAIDHPTSSRAVTKRSTRRGVRVQRCARYGGNTSQDLTTRRSSRTSAFFHVPNCSH
jgi:hypothetical protein